MFLLFVVLINVAAHNPMLECLHSVAVWALDGFLDSVEVLKS